MVDRQSRVLLFSLGMLLIAGSAFAQLTLTLWNGSPLSDAQKIARCDDLN
jgi:hypothetical protein